MSKIPFNENEMNIAYTVPNLFDPTGLIHSLKRMQYRNCMPELPHGVLPVWKRGSLLPL